MAYTHLDPGRELEISARIYFSPTQMDISELVKLSPEQLKAQEEDSVEQEKAIYEKFHEIEKEWAKQAMLTVSLRKAQEYLRIPAPSHTSNQWAEKEYDWHEISNMVYKMTYRIYEGTDYRSNIKPRPVYWELSWYVTFNTPQNPDYSGNGRQLAGQQGKKFKDRAEMEKYLQGRIKAYSHLFTEISPPIPEDARRRFCVNGVLLPGYTVDTPKLTRPDEKNVDSLLSLLEDEDIISGPPLEEPAPAAQPVPAAPKAARPAARKKSAPKKSSPVR